MKRAILPIIIFLIVLSPVLSLGQSQALYNLGSQIPQNAYYNPAFIPQGSFVLGLPVISGVSVGLNAETSYNAIVSEATGEDDFINFDEVIDKLDEKSFFHANARVSDLFLGVRVRDAFISLFVNERVNFDAHLPKSLIEVVAEGSNAFENRFFNLEDLGADVKYYREYGIGYAKQVSNVMSFGARVKFLQGVFGARTDRDVSARLRQPDEESPLLDFQFRNAVYNSSGQDILEDGDVGSIISNASRGVAVDLGLQYQLTRSASFAIGLSDLGFITWKEDPENFTLQGSTLIYEGVGETPTIDDFSDLVQDSLYDVIERVETFDNFTTGVNARSYISMFFQPTYKDQINVTLSTRFVLGRARTSLGAGITHSFGKYFTLGGNAALASQTGFDIGTSMALNLGPFQLYTAYDNLLSIAKPEEIEAFQASFGINFIFGRTLKKSKDPRQEIIDRNNEAYPDYPAAKGTYTPIIREEGIYQIVKEQKEPVPRRVQPSSRDGRDTGWLPIYKKPKKRRHSDFNKQSDERGIRRFFFWNNWFGNN